MAINPRTETTTSLRGADRSADTRSPVRLLGKNDDVGFKRAEFSETISRIVKVAVAVVYLAWDSVRLILFRLAGHSVRSRFVVLMYHSVKRHECDRFARQMDLLRRIVNPVRADFARAEISNGGSYVAVTFDDGYQSVLKNAIPILRERGIPATLFVPTKCLGSRPAWITNDRHRNADERLLTPDELRFVQRNGGLIGSHGVNHLPLTELSPEEAFAEMIESKKALQQMLGAKVDLFALPYGAWNSDVLRLATRAGYERVFLSVPGPFGGNIDRRLFGRVDVSPTDWAPEYRLKILGAYRWLPFAIAAKSQIKNVLRRVAIATSKFFKRKCCRTFSLLQRETKQPS
jgi:peptidoglycan/xylan/chitin deacetylase (PgdA/CDA1 family)